MPRPCTGSASVSSDSPFPSPTSWRASPCHTVLILRGFCPRSVDFWHDHATGESIHEQVFYSTNYYTTRTIDIIRNHTQHAPADQGLWVHLMYQGVHFPYVDTPTCEPASAHAACSSVMTDRTDRQAAHSALRGVPLC